MTILKYIYIGLVCAGAIAVLAGMIIDTSIMELSQNLLNIGLGAVIAGVILYIPIFIKERIIKK